MAGVPFGTQVSNLMSRLMAAAKAGISFSGYRDVYTVFGYKRVLTAQDMLERMTRQDIAKTCMVKPAEGIWANPPKVTCNDGFVTAWEKLVPKFSLWSILLRADKMLAYEPYVILFLGLPGKPDTAVTAATVDELKYIQPYGASDAQIATYETDPASVRFGLPLHYRISVKGSPIGVLAHWSRCLHLTNELVKDNLSSDPRMLAGWNLFDDMVKVAGGSAETYWLTGNRGMQVDVDKEMELDDDEAKALSDELDEFQHQLRRYVRTRGVKINTLGAEVADPSGPFRVTISLLAATYGIPQRVLMGSEAGALASEQDRANWAEVIQNRRETFAEPYVLTPFILKLSNLGILPRVKVENLAYEWPNAFHLSPLEKAQTMAQTARALVNISRQAEKGHPIATLSEARLICNLPAETPKGVSFPEFNDNSLDPKAKKTTSVAQPEAVTGDGSNEAAASDTTRGKSTTQTPASQE